jgi:aspartate/methionine/tyrosine aminotransferase
MKDLVGQYAASWKDRGGIFSLAQGVVYWTPPDSARLAMKETLDDERNMLHMYGPDEGLEELRDALTDKVATENGLTDHHVMVTVGANQAYTNCVLTLLEEGQACVVFKPYYCKCVVMKLSLPVQNCTHCCLTVGMLSHTNHLTTQTHSSTVNHVMALQMTLPPSGLIVGPTSDEGLPDLAWLETELQQKENIRAVTLVNPGNPTGTLLSRAFLQQAVDLTRKYGVWLILDCTYEYFVPDSDFDGCFRDPHVLHIFSFSKAYALAGYRCGYLAIPKQAGDLYEQMIKVQDTIPIAPSRISQVAALGAMKAGKDWVRGKIATLDTGREAILSAVGSSLEQVMGGSGAMYVMGKLPDGTDDQEFARLLVQDFGVAVIPGSFCGFPGWIRVCYSNLPPEQCQEAAVRLEKGLKSLTSS